MGTSEMTFWDHLDELRSSLLRILAVVVILAVGLFFWLPSLFDPVILGPCFGYFLTYRWFCTLGDLFGLTSPFCDTSFNVGMINLELTAQLLLHLRVAFLLSLVLGCPYLLYEIWRFVRPAFYANERRAFSLAFLLGGALFYVGLTLCYLFIFPITLRFLVGYHVSEHVLNQLSLSSYMSTFLNMHLVFGLVFELPMVALILGKMGLISRAFFKRWRRHAIVLLVFLAALITPTGDPFTLALVSVPLYLLYELSALLVKNE